MTVYLDDESDEKSIMSMKASKPTTTSTPTTTTTQRPFVSKTTASPYKNSYVNTSSAPPRGTAYTPSTTGSGSIKYSSTQSPTLTESIEIDDSDNDEDIEYYDDDYGIADENIRNSKENSSQKPLMPHQFTIAQNNNNADDKGNSNNKNTGKQSNNMATTSFQQQPQKHPNHGSSLTNTQSHGTMHENFYPNSFQKNNFNLNSNNNDHNKPLPFSTQRPMQTNLFTSQASPAPRFPLIPHPKGQSISPSGFSELSLQAHQQKAQGFKLTNQYQQKQQQQLQMQEILMHQEQDKKQQQKQQQQLLQQQYQQQRHQQQYKQQSHRRPENILLEERFEGYRRQTVPQVTLPTTVAHEVSISSCTPKFRPNLEV
jgi:hypothetical protein